MVKRLVTRIASRAVRMARVFGVVAERSRPRRVEEPERRLENRRQLDLEIRTEALDLRSAPSVLILEPATACNLKCPFCPTGGGYGKFRKELLRPETFARIVDRLDLQRLEEVLLYNWGEPLLNPNLFDYVRFFSARGIRTEVSTNLSTHELDDASCLALLRSGLDQLIVSIDGATEATYSTYRIGGDFDRVIRNLGRLSAMRRHLGNPGPRIVYKMLLNRFNEHEVEDARRLADQLDVEFLLDEKFWCPEEHVSTWATSQTRIEGSKVLMAYGPSADGAMSTFCRQLWDTLVVNANGDVLPCCLVFDPSHAVGNLTRQSVEAIRNGPAMRDLRRFVSQQHAAPPSRPSHCVECPSRWCRLRDAGGQPQQPGRSLAVV